MASVDETDTSVSYETFALVTQKIESLGPSSGTPDTADRDPIDATPGDAMDSSTLISSFHHFCK